MMQCHPGRQAAPSSTARSCGTSGTQKIPGTCRTAPASSSSPCDGIQGTSRRTWFSPLLSRVWRSAPEWSPFVRGSACSRTAPYDCTHGTAFRRMWWIPRPCENLCHISASIVRDYQPLLPSQTIAWIFPMIKSGQLGPGLDIRRRQMRMLLASHHATRMAVDVQHGQRAIVRTGSSGVSTGPIE